MALMVVWGSTYVVTKVAVREFPPLALALLRFVIAACVLVPIACARGGFERLPKPLPIVPLALMGLTGVAGSSPSSACGSPLCERGRATETELRGFDKLSPRAVNFISYYVCIGRPKS